LKLRTGQLNPDATALAHGCGLNYAARARERIQDRIVPFRQELYQCSEKFRRKRTREPFLSRRFGSCDETGKVRPRKIIREYEDI